ncbi:MAG: signal peptide peptidase SppA [Bdellovibrionales bacterium]
MKKSPWSYIAIAMLLFFGGSILFLGGSCVSLLQRKEVRVDKPGILAMDLSGVILESKSFVKKLKKYREDENIKAIVIRVNSPGGAVGPSQEIYEEIKHTREKYKLPVVMSVESLAASGAYYAAAGADFVIAQPGSLIGSIGVIMEFINLKDLYSWAKVERYSIKTGPFKDIGADYRPMRPDEKALLQTVINDVYMQFKKAVADGRKLTLEKVNTLADGRILTGKMAQESGLVDQLGSFKDAIAKASEMAQLGEDPEVFEIPRTPRNLFEFLEEMNEEEAESTAQIARQMIDDFLQLKLSGQPLLIYSGAVRAFSH